MRVVIAGGSGFLGSSLVRSLRTDGHEVTVLTRRPPASAGQVSWDPRNPSGDWTSALAGAGAVVNLAGHSIASGRWTSARKSAILNSRLQATHGLVAAFLMDGSPPPPVFVSASAVGYYGPCGDEEVTEDSPTGSDFLAHVCHDWEQAALAARDVTRVVLLRGGLVLDRQGGALPLMALPFRLFAGGPVGSGRQYVPWIHLADWTALARWSIDTAVVSGPLNATAPAPITNREFGEELGRALRRPSALPAPAFALRMVLGEMADVLLTGQRALPARAKAEGFTFRHPELGAALRAIYEGGRTRTVP